MLEAEGTYADKSGEFNVKGNLHDFPMPMLNAFLEGTDVALRGKAGGDLRYKEQQRTDTQWFVRCGFWPRLL